MPEEIRAKITGTVWKIEVAKGEEIEDGDDIMILESMKMEIPVLTEISGVVAEIAVAPGDVIHEGDLIAVIGSPGGRTIINTTLQLILNMVDFDMDIQEAVDASRMHHQWLPDRIRLEAGAVTPDVVEALEERGHTVQMGGRQGSANAIGVNPRTGERMGAPDPRSADAGAVGVGAREGSR